MMLRYAHACTAPPEAAWSLLSRPDCWPEWSPHLRGAWGLGSPEVVSDGDGCRVVVEMRAPKPVEAALAVTYGPVVDLLVRNCARVAAARRPHRAPDVH